MYPLLVSFAVLSTAGLVMIVRAAFTAPVGFEDARGFHADHPGDLATPLVAEANFKFEDLFFPDQRLASQPWQ